MPLTKRQAAKKSEQIELAMTEAELTRSIVAAAKELGYKVYFTWRSIHSPAGYPDLTMTRNGKLLIWEAKSAKGVVKPAQQEWLDALGQVPGVDARVVRPADLEQAYEALICGHW